MKRIQTLDTRDLAQSAKNGGLTKGRRLDALRLCGAFL